MQVLSRNNNSLGIREMLNW